MKTIQTPTDALYIAIELSNKNWKVGFSTRRTARPRLVNISAGNVKRLLEEVRKARDKLQVAESAPVHCVYEAGRDGFWLHRLLEKADIQNLVIDPGSIERPRRKHAKTDRLDVQLLMNRLLRWLDGDRQVWKVVRVPGPEAEAERTRSREWRSLRTEQTRMMSRIRSVLVRYGIRVSGRLHSRLKEELNDLRGPCDIQLPRQEIECLERELDRLALLEEQIKTMEQQRRKRLETPESTTEKKARRLIGLKGVGPVSAECLAQEFFFRDFRNRREVGGASGLTGTPYESGSSSREGGIGKQGNKRVRTAMVELAWMWQRHQPQSALSRWYRDRYGGGSKRHRRIGIVALARKLLIALWRYVETGAVPEGAIVAG